MTLKRKVKSGAEKKRDKKAEKKRDKKAKEKSDKKLLKRIPRLSTFGFVTSDDDHHGDVGTKVGTSENAKDSDGSK